ncbi:MAG: DUF4058 family protein [Gemmataceae bacterium]|nr:DUF4058 family protein [Gemmataceae bacterium]
MSEITPQSEGGLSPSNGRSGTEGWDIYLRKRQCLLLGGADLVETDLLRGHER